MQNKRILVNLHAPRVEANKVFLSWDQSPVFEESSYWIEYKGLKELHCRPDALLEAYLPICIALSFLGNVTIKLPGYVSPVVLETWRNVCVNTTRAIGKRTADIEFVIPNVAKGQPPQDQNFQETALLFGGGSEALLTLAHLLDQKVSPYLISLWGDSWTGSDLSKNHERFDLEEDICRDLRLRIIRIHTNLRTIFHKKNFRPFLRKKIYIIDAVFTLPICVSVILPVAGQLHIGSIISGNEKEYSGCLQQYNCSREMIRSLSLPGEYVSYSSKLEDFTKVRIIKELHQKYSHIAKHQYSCYSAIHKRWCLKCTKCLTNYLIYKIFDIDPASVGMDEAAMLRNFPDTILEAKMKYRENKYNLKVWSGIRREAVMQNKKEIVKLIDSFYKNTWLLKIYFFLKGV